MKYFVLVLLCITFYKLGNTQVITDDENRITHVQREIEAVKVELEIVKREHKYYKQRFQEIVNEYSQCLEDLSRERVLDN